MLIIPIQPLPNQLMSVVLAGQNCKINVYQKFTGLFFDLFVNDDLVIGGVICENGNRIVRSKYLGFIGDFIFYDVLGNSDPYYTGLGGQYQLLYLEASDLDTLGLVA